MGSPRFAWGIDVGNRALKAIRLVRDGEQLKIDEFEVIEHEQILSQAGDNRESLLQTSLANFAQKHSAKGGAVAISVSGQASFARFIKLPPVDPAKVPDIVKFEAIQQIPFPLEDVEWSYQLFQPPDSPEVEVGIFAMRKDLVNQVIKYFADVGLEVGVVQTSPLAVYNGLYADGRIDDTTMIVDVGAENSDLIIAENETIWMRSIPIGGNNFTEALVKSFKLKFPKAEDLKRNAATSKYGRQILQAMKPVFSDLVGEIQRSIGFYSSTHRESRIAKVLALGGTFRLPGLQKYLQQNLQLDVVRIDRLNAPMPSEARMATSFNENILSSIGAYGLALQAMGQAKVTSSLLPEKIRRERMWRDKTRWFAAAALLFLAGTGISVGKLYADRWAYEEQNNLYKTKIDAIQSQANNMSKTWEGIETSGNDDRTQITNYMSLLADRDVTISVCQGLAKAFPQSSPQELQKQPRGDRNVVDLVTWRMHYLGDITPLVARNGKEFAMRDDEFNPLADKLEMIPGANGNPMNSETFNFRGAGQGKTGDKRGFMVTLLCKTPANEATRVVSETVVARLLAQMLKPGEKPGFYSIERVTITKKERVGDVYHAGTAFKPRPPMTFTPPKANGEPNDANAANGDLNPKVAANLFPDPMNKDESIENDSLVTVLVAVVVDPVEKPATASVPVRAKK